MTPSRKGLGSVQSHTVDPCRCRDRKRNMNWLDAVLDDDNDKRFADHDHEGRGRPADTATRIILNHAHEKDRFHHDER